MKTLEILDLKIEAHQEAMYGLPLAKTYEPERRVHKEIIEQLRVKILKYKKKYGIITKTHS